MVGNMHAKTQKDAEGPVGPSTWHGGGYKPSSVPALRQGALIPLTGPLPAGSSGLPGNRPPRGGSGDGSRRSPYLALHRTGFAVPRPSPAKRWALTPPFHPYPAALAGRYVFCGTFPRVAAAGRYPACSHQEFGLSSVPPDAGSRAPAASGATTILRLIGACGVGYPAVSGPAHREDAGSCLGVR